jgi:hypothetical protein
MTITNYRLDSNPEMGFSIQEDMHNKIGNQTRKTSVTLWIDEYEGGEAYDTDWTYIGEFDTHEAALDYVFEKYGAVTKIAIY